MNFTLEQATKAQRGSGCIALLFLEPRRFRSGGWSMTHPGWLTVGKDSVPIVEEAGWAPRPVWTDAENLAPPPGFDPRTVQPVASRYTD